MNEEFKESIKSVKNAANVAYSGQSRNYKQKLLYNLLSAVKSKDRSRFINILDTNLNGIIKRSDQMSIANDLLNEYENIQGPHFETYAYAIIAGILASKDGKTIRESVEEVEKNG